MLTSSMSAFSETSTTKMTSCFVCRHAEQEVNKTSSCLRILSLLINYSLMRTEIVGHSSFIKHHTNDSDKWILTIFVYQVYRFSPNLTNIYNRHFVNGKGRK